MAHEPSEHDTEVPDDIADREAFNAHFQHEAFEEIARAHSI